MMTAPIFDVTTAVAVLNQTLEYAYPSIVIVGELSEFRISKGKWLYFDIKDKMSKLKCFGTVYQLKMPLEDGMMIEVVAQPKLHNLYGFSLNVQAVRPVGEGNLKKAANLLQAKLEKEGLFDKDRRRQLPYPPEHIALIASGESAGYADFMKIVKVRWPYIVIDHYEVHVQGLLAEEEVVRAVHGVNEQSSAPEVIVIIRGGGSADDMSAFSTESVTRAIAASRIPTLVAIGHEIDTSLAELAADQRASTPSNAAELLVPDKQTIIRDLLSKKILIAKIVEDELAARRQSLSQYLGLLDNAVEHFIERARSSLEHGALRLESYHPGQILKRGYAIVKHEGKLVRDVRKLAKNDTIDVELSSGYLIATVDSIKGNKESK